MRNGLDNQLSRWTARLSFSSLRIRLLLLLFLALLPAYGFILYSVFETRQQAAEHARENALWLTRLMASEQKNLIEVIRQQLQSLAQLAIVRRPEQAGLCNQTFAALRRQNAYFTNMGVIDPAGGLRCSALPFTSRVNLSDRDYFRDVMHTRAFAVGGYVLGRRTGKGIINLGYPVLSAAGHPEAVVYISLDLAVLADKLIETTSLPEGSTLTILDHHGTILVRQPDPERWVGKSLPDSALIQTILSHGKEGSAEETGIDGVERLYVFKPFYSTAAKQAYVSVGIPTSIVFAEAQQLLARALLLMALVTVAVVVVAWVSGTMLVLQPANALMQAARRLRQGDLSARTDLPHSSNEFGQIARSFDDMANALQTRESEAVRAEARFTNIVNQATDAIISLDEDQRILVFNHGAEQIFGYTAVEMLGQPLDQLLPVHLTEAHREHIRRFAAEPGAARSMNRRGEIRGRRKDGTEFPAEASISKVMESGKFRFTVFLVDISVRKMAEAETQLLRSRAIFENLFVSLPGLYLVLTPDLRIVAASDAYLKATMTKREEIAGRDLFEVFPDNPDDPAANSVSNLRASLDRVRQTAAVDTMAIQKYDIRRPDGTFEERYWSPINSPVPGTDRQIEYIIHRVEDVTEFVRQKPRPAGDAAVLRTRMEQMEAEIFQSSQKIQTANQQLNAANQELEAFSYSVSHDLRAPLRAIDGFSQAVIEDYADKLDDQGRGYLNRVRAATQHMGHLIDDLIKLARVARAEMKRETVDLSALAGNLLTDLQTSEPERMVDWRIEPGLIAAGDAHLLRVALDNLLGNAWKFTARQARAHIEFGALRQEAGGLAYFVRDNGVGFDMTYADKLFGAFQRLHAMSEFPGTGIGLATVQRIIRRHGGRVWAEGATGKGATFYFSL